jgi:hypothetical protein
MTRSHQKSLNLLVIATLLAACDQNPAVTIHPTPENIPEIEDQRFVLQHEAVDTLRYANPDDYDKITIGVEEGDVQDMIGSISDLASDHRGTLYVLDDAYSHVRAYDYGGNLIGTFGSEGEGPGEFHKPWNIAVVDDGNTIIVSSFSSRRINLFTRQQSTFSFRSSFTREGAGAGMCAMNGYIFLLSDIPGVDGIIHRYTLDGEREVSFGYRYQASDLFVQRSLSHRGYLACNEEHDVVAWIRNFVPILTGYSSDGDLKWQVRFADFQPTLVESGLNSEGVDRVTYSNPQPGQSMFFDLFSDSGSGFYSLYATFGADEKGGPHMFRFDAMTGLGQEIANAGPPIPRLVDGEYYVTYASNPYAKFTIYQPRTRSTE